MNEEDKMSESDVLNAAREILNNKMPEEIQAPHGRDEQGKPLAPYGYKKSDGLPKILPGRPDVKKDERGKLQDEKDLLSDLQETVNLDEYKEALAAIVEQAPPAAQEVITEQAPAQQPAAPAIPAPVTIAAAEPAARPAASKYKVYINGGMFLFALDIMIPKTIELVYGFLGLQFVDPNELKLDADDREELTPLCNDLVEELLGSLSPLQQFLLYTTIVYGNKAQAADKKPKGREKKKIEPITIKSKTKFRKR